MSEEKNKTQRVSFKFDSNGKVVATQDINGRWEMITYPEKTEPQYITGIDPYETTSSGTVCIYKRTSNGLVTATVKPYKITNYACINNLYLKLIKTFIKIGWYD